MRLHRFIPAAAAWLLCLPILGETPSILETVPFASGRDGYHTYRIPAIVRATNGMLLAFCEGRKSSASDAGDIDIVLRRSKDRGATWDSLSVVQEEGGNARITIGNPVPIVDEFTGFIHLLFCRDNSRVFHIVSTNNGTDWSPRREITSEVKRPDWTWYATGPGHGIQLKRGTQKGRLVAACDHRAGQDVYGVQAAFSDDHGVTWRLGAVNPSSAGVNPNETLCEELLPVSANSGSRIYFNTRDHKGAAAGTRGEAWSADGGSTFKGPFTNNLGFVCPVVQGSLIRFHATDQGSADNLILFACPNSESRRVNMSVWVSTDEARSWSDPKSVYSGPSAYSDLVRLNENETGLLYEKGQKSAYEMIAFARLSKSWLESAKPRSIPSVRDRD